MCLEPVYSAPQWKLDKAASGERPLKPSDLKHETEFKNLCAESVQLDCPFCFGDVLELHSAGGYRLYLEEDQNFTDKGRRHLRTRMVRFPNVSRREPAVRVVRGHYADPNCHFADSRESLIR